MFSEYASRFLAQSQSRIAFSPDNNDRQASDRHNRRFNQAPGSSRNPASRSYLHRALGNPYQPSSSHISHFPFSSRASIQHAPLFYSAADEFREEDDEQEHEREIADFYALQRSRRHFDSRHLEESSEVDNDGKHSEDSIDASASSHSNGRGRGGGIKSSWRASRSSDATPVLGARPFEQRDESDGNEGNDRRSAGSNSLGKDRMVDVGLEDTLRSDMINVQRNSSHDSIANDEPPPAIQQFRKPPDVAGDHFQASSSFHPKERDNRTLLEYHRPLSSGGSSVPASMTHPGSEPPQHDSFWGNLFLISVAGMFATAFLIYLHTSLPEGRPILGDTIYATLHASFFLLAIYTLISVLVSLLWLALLRSYVRPLVYGILIAVPVVLYSFALYPYISSFGGTWHGQSIQDKVMRWGSLVPAIMASVWVYSVIQGRLAIGKSISILEFSCRILASNPALLPLGFVILVIIASWTWVWIFMFARVFLGGHISASKNVFIIDAGSWWLGVYFILVYLWSLGVISSIQRTVTAATVSQWYFHRLSIPTPSSRQIVQAALVHSVSTLFGTICLSTLLALLIRLPLIILPRRLSSFLTLAAYSCVPTPIAALINPLALTYSAIHSLPLGVSAHSLSQMAFLTPSTATTSFNPSSFSSSRNGRNDTHGNSSSLLPYHLARLLLHATRFIMSLGLGFGGWVSTARNLRLATTGTGTTTIRGSLYAYVVGLIAGTIGWGVLGAMEGVLTGVVDAAVVCWASEVGSSRREARYCREAGWLFGGERNGGRGGEGEGDYDV
ncbi:conserved hypothetical protein [Histoplasma capsulatum G186AR]|uniref:Protein PNS1 n=3 Tax=Histoplasma TaxID=5036 RepID=C0NYG3_AJECG|nr:uncharacterized protein HCBG_07957 [Histoplasma capsulatum G186AR]EEH03831.1 conserved hypothetical protein [Histoplasma capsulatum G186AR]KAG5293594.1 choline transporter superfamily domain-containing protein [Histoplasma capsulatum]QSS75045.1 choline transporter superfamily domain-containing protein [Histoplasma capsulatum G186AR]